MSKKPKAVEPQVATWASHGQRIVVFALAALVPLVFTKFALEPHATPKATTLAFGAAAIIALQLTRVIATGRLHVPWGWFGAVSAAFAIALVIATGVGGWRASSVLGAAGRSSGLITYIAAAVAFVTIVRRFDARQLKYLIWVLIATAATVASIAVVQRIAPSLLPFQVASELAGVNATLSNPNFASGLIGICLPLAAWAALEARTLQGRVLMLAALALSLGGLWAADSLQGWFAGLVGIFVLLAGRISLLPDRLRRKAAIGATGAAVVGMIVFALGIAGRGPLGIVGQQSTFLIRSWYWRAAVDMWRDNPLLGVGLDQYANYYRAYRPLEATLAFPVHLSNDAAHNVPLMMLTGGGILLGLAFASLVVFTAWKGIEALRGTVQQRHLVAGLAGAWFAYHVQGAVSIDVVPLALVHFLLAGAIVATSGTASFKEVVLPWGRMRRRSRKRAARASWVGAAIGGVVILTALLVSIRVLRADMVAGTGSRALNASQPQPAIEALQRAVDSAPRRSRYRVLLGRAQYGANQLRNARETFDAAVALEPRDYEAVLWQARARAVVGDVDDARAAYARTLELEPTHPQLKVEIARFEASEGRVGRARELLDAALAVDPNHAEGRQLQQTLESATTAGS